MSDAFSYHDYVRDEGLIKSYSSYQQRYVSQVRESDRVLILRVQEVLKARPSGQPPAALLDVGCSTGNFLRHLRQAEPGLALTGVDLMEAVISTCRADDALAGIRFDVRDMLDLGYVEAFDLVTVNAVFYMLDDEQLEQALAQVARALKPGGMVLVFDFFHGFPQDLAILEKSASHPEGLMLHFRPQKSMQDRLLRHGFTGVTFKPFEITIDLEQGTTFSSNEEGKEDLNSYTVRDASGRRMLFRGALHQPWCHLVAQKGG